MSPACEVVLVLVGVHAGESIGCRCDYVTVHCAHKCALRLTPRYNTLLIRDHHDPSPASEQYTCQCATGLLGESIVIVVRCSSPRNGADSSIQLVTDSDMPPSAYPYFVNMRRPSHQQCLGFCPDSGWIVCAGLAVDVAPHLPVRSQCI